MLHGAVYDPFFPPIVCVCVCVGRNKLLNKSSGSLGLNHLILKTNNVIHLKTVLLSPNISIFFFFLLLVGAKMSAQPHMDHMCCLAASLCSRARISSLFGRNLMRCYTLIRFHGFWGFGDVYNAFMTKTHHSPLLFLPGE